MNCSTCYGNNIGCGTFYCTIPCFNGPCPACDACTAKWCTPSLEACVAIPDSLMP